MPGPTEGNRERETVSMGGIMDAGSNKSGDDGAVQSGDLSHYQHHHQQQYQQLDKLSTEQRRGRQQDEYTTDNDNNQLSVWQPRAAGIIRPKAVRPQTAHPSSNLRNQRQLRGAHGAFRGSTPKAGGRDRQMTDVKVVSANEAGVVNGGGALRPTSAISKGSGDWVTAVVSQRSRPSSAAQRSHSTR